MTTEELMEESRKWREIEEQKRAEAERFRKLAAFHQQEYLTALEDYANCLGEFATKLAGERYEVS